MASYSALRLNLLPIYEVMLPAVSDMEAGYLNVSPDHVHNSRGRCCHVDELVRGIAGIYLPGD